MTDAELRQKFLELIDRCLAELERAGDDEGAARVAAARLDEHVDALFEEFEQE